jgi:hypothetical protein
MKILILPTRLGLHFPDLLSVTKSRNHLFCELLNNIWIRKVYLFIINKSFNENNVFIPDKNKNMRKVKEKLFRLLLGSKKALR